MLIGAGVQPTTTSTTDDFGVGQRLLYRDETVGWQEWIWVQADAEVEQGEVCAYKLGTTTYEVILQTVQAATVLTESAARTAGVAQHTIAAASYGFILQKGLGEVKADTGAITANFAIVAGLAGGTAGLASNFAAGYEHRVIGYATEAAASTALATAMIQLG